MSNDSRFTVPKEKQLKILSKYSDPTDLIERSYFQYKCQYEMLDKAKYLYQISAFIILIVLRFIIPSKIKSNNPKYDLVCFIDGVDKSIIPRKLLERYNRIVLFKSRSQMLMTSQDRKWIYKRIIKRYPYDFFFILKTLINISNYSYIIETFHPDAISNHIEYSCCSSLLTQYCIDNKVKHINFMHGEKIWSIRDSFFCFDECYVWDKHYISMFKELHAKGNFIIDIPRKFRQVPNTSSTLHLSNCDYCYYLANESKEQIDMIIDCLQKLTYKGYSTRVRLHPRYGNHKYIISECQKRKIMVEKQNIDINESIMTTQNSISLFSTVLMQSYYLNKNIIIDDVTCSEKYNILKKLDYIALSYPHRLLSSILEEG